MVDELECSLQAEPEYRLGEEINIRFALTNRANYSVWILKWNTPLEGLLSNHFRVTLNGQPLRYDGIFINRGDPGKDEYVRLAPGDTVSSTVDLSTAYPIDQTGQYQAALNLRIHDVVREPEGPVEIPRPRDAHVATKLDCNAIAFRVVGDGTPRLTDGQRARAAENSARKEKETAIESSVDSAPVVMPLIYGCSPEQQLVVLTAHAGAYYRALAAIENLNADSSDNSLYVTWFGEYDSSRWQSVVSKYSALRNALVAAQFTYVFKGPYCQPYAYAYTFTGTTTIYLCDLFWDALPTGVDSQTEKVVHELTHAAALTSDWAYGTIGCKQLAKNYPAEAVDNGDSYGYFSNNVPVIEWGESTKYDTGSKTTLAVAMDDYWNVVELHRGEESPENHYYIVGRVDVSSKTITWGESIKYDTGSTLAVAMDNSGNIVEIHGGHEDPQKHYYMVGKLDPSYRTIAWGESMEYDTGSQLAVAMDDSGNIVEVHRGHEEPKNHYYRVGKLNASTQTITWGESTKYDTGSTSAITMNNSGTVVEIHRGYEDDQKHYYIVGQLDADNQTVTWGKSIQYDTGSNLAIAMDESGNVVEIHSGYTNPENHYCLTGTFANKYLDDATLTTIIWSSTTKYDTGSALALAMDNHGNLVEIHCGHEKPENHYYRIGKVIFPG